MRHLALGAVLCLAMAPPAGAQTPDAELMMPIQRFIDSFNKGDMAAAGATHAATSDLTIIDEVPPYLWRGPQAFQVWAADLESDSRKLGIAGQAVTISAATREERNGDQAYVVAPALYTFTQRGVSMREAAQMTFVLKKAADGWLIHGWAWTGPKPARAPATP